MRTGCGITAGISRIVAHARAPMSTSATQLLQNNWRQQRNRRSHLGRFPATSRGQRESDPA